MQVAAIKENDRSPLSTSIIVAFERFPNENLPGLFESTKSFSTKYEIILVAGKIESGQDNKKILFNLSQGKPNLVKTRLVLMDLEGDRGVSFGRNLGAFLADSSILVFVDDDSLILDDVSPLLELLLANKCQGIQPLLVKLDAETVDSAGDFIKKVDRTRYNSYCRHTGMPLSKLGNLQAEEVPYLRSAFMIVNKDVFLKIGLFDSTFIFNFEDVDLGLRMTCAGYRLLFVPKVKELHKGSRTACNMISDRVLRLSVLNTHALYLKIAPYSFWPYIVLAHFQRSVLRYEMSRLRQKKATPASAIKDSFVMNKLFISRVRQARIHRNILRKFGLPGRQKLEDMANGKRFFYKG